MKHRREYGVPAGRQRDWIPVTTLAVPTVWLATADGLVCIDLVAVERAANGLRKGWSLTAYEAAFAADLMLRQGMDRSRIAERVGLSGQSMRRWFPTDTTPLSEALAQIRTRSEASAIGNANRGRQARCGTYRGAQRHRKRREPPCEPCQEARRVAERHYRAHGTYVGAPEIAA